MASCLVTLLVAGVLSYLADSDPDGLDAATRHGCTASAPGEVSGELSGELSGDCVARDARSHPLAGTPLAGYTVGGDERLTGLAGVFGSGVVLVLAGGVFWLLRRRTPHS